MSDLVRDFATLFEGRLDAFGTDEGGCVRLGKPWLARVEDHLGGRAPLGVYPLRPLTFGVSTWQARWGCSDLDYDDPTDAWNLHAVWRHLGVTAWVERSRSKGHHVWVFADTWVHARVMREAFLAVHQIADVAAKEVNPKSVGTEDPEFLGNYVRLPYPLRSPDRQVVLHATDQGAMSLGYFVSRALDSRTTQSQLEEVAKLYVVPPPKRTVQISHVPRAGATLIGAMSPLTHKVWSEGPREGEDRSGTLVYLAHLLAENRPAFTPGEALTLLRSAEQTWGECKFSSRSDGDRYLEEMIQQAYG